MEKISTFLPFKIDRNVQVAVGVGIAIAASGYVVSKVAASIKYSVILVKDKVQTWKCSGLFKKLSC